MNLSYVKKHRIDFIHFLSVLIVFFFLASGNAPAFAKGGKGPKKAFMKGSNDSSMKNPAGVLMHTTACTYLRYPESGTCFFALILFSLMTLALFNLYDRTLCRSPEGQECVIF